MDDEKNLTDAVETALGFRKSDGMEAFIDGHRIGFTRFSNGRITQNVSRSKFIMTVKTWFGAREGLCRTTDFSRASLEAAVRTAEEIARNSGENLEFAPPVRPCAVPNVESYFESTARTGPKERASMAGRMLARCSGSGLSCAGLLGNGTLFRVFGNSEGHSAYHRGSWARMTCTVLTGNSSGWKRATAENISDIDPDGVFESALSTAEKSRDPADIEPGKYTVVLGSPAVSEMLAFLFWCWDAKSAHEGRSFMSGKVGSAIAAPCISISSVPGHPKAPGFPFQQDGLPQARVDWIRNGRAVNLTRDRFWAGKLGLTPTGQPSNWIMDGTDATVDELVAGISRGILVSRFWYVRYVDQIELLLTGMTRDGTFLIEDGRIMCGVKNMRWNDSIPSILNRVEAVGTPVREGESMDTVVPPLVVRDFNFTSKTLF